MNVLIAWELGAGLGHLGRHLELALVLTRRGHQVTFAVKDLRLAHTVLGATEYRYVQSPRVGRPKPLEHPICNYADILDHHGMADAHTCMALLQAWAQLFTLCETDVVLLDHAPAALFAAKCRGIQTLELASGFFCPPRQTPYPVFRPWEGISQSDLLTRESACLVAMNPFALLHDVGPFSTLAHAMTSSVPLLTTFAELDHYPQRRAGRYIGPIEGSTGGDPINWSGLAKHRVFVYLHSLPGVPDLLARLAKLDAEFIVYCPDLDLQQRQAFQSSTMNLVERPVQIQQMLTNCDLVINNAGHGLVTACVLFAVPVLGIPIHIEQGLVADAITRNGIGMGLRPADIPIHFDQVVQSMLRDSKHKVAALALQHKYRNFDLQRTLERVANTIERMKALTGPASDVHAYESEVL